MSPYAQLPHRSEVPGSQQPMIQQALGAVQGEERSVSPTWGSQPLEDARGAILGLVSEARVAQMSQVETSEALVGEKRKEEGSQASFHSVLEAEGARASWQTGGRVSFSGTPKHRKVPNYAWPLTKTPPATPVAIESRTPPSFSFQGVSGFNPESLWMSGVPPPPPLPDFASATAQAIKLRSSEETTPSPLGIPIAPPPAPLGAPFMNAGFGTASSQWTATGPASSLPGPFAQVSGAQAPTAQVPGPFAQVSGAQAPDCSRRTGSKPLRPGLRCTGSRLLQAHRFQALLPQVSGAQAASSFAQFSGAQAPVGLTFGAPVAPPAPPIAFAAGLGTQVQGVPANPPTGARVEEPSRYIQSLPKLHPGARGRYPWRLAGYHFPGGRIFVFWFCRMVCRDTSSGGRALRSLVGQRSGVSPCC